jgi:hypothetical protein
MREHRQLTYLLNVLLKGGATIQARRHRHLWAIAHEGDLAGQKAKWVQEFYFTNFGAPVSDELSPPALESLAQVDPDAYYSTISHYLSGLRVPADLDDSICCYQRLSKANRDKFGRAGFWMDMASRQWTDSSSASFASLVIAIESLAERNCRPTARFYNFIERYTPDSNPDRRKKMYALRSEILHGSGLMEMDQNTLFGSWAPPELTEEDLMTQLSTLTRIAVRNWIKNPSPT